MNWGNGVGSLLIRSERSGEENRTVLGTQFQILGPVQRIDCAHLDVEEGAWTIVVPLLVDVLEVRIWRWKML